MNNNNKYDKYEVRVVLTPKYKHFAKLVAETDEGDKFIKWLSEKDAMIIIEMTGEVYDS